MLVASAKRVIELETEIMTGNIIVKAAPVVVLLARTLTSGCPSMKVVCRSIGLFAPARVVVRGKFITAVHMSSGCDQPKNTANGCKHLETTA